MERKTFFSGIVSIFSSNVAAVAIAAATGIILPRYLGPQMLGRLNSALALVAIVYSISFLGIRSAIVIIRGQADFDLKQIVSAITFIFLISLVLSTIMLLVSLLAISDDTYAFALILLLCLLNPFDFMLSYLSGFSLSEKRFGLFNRINLYPKAIQLALILILHFFFRLNVLTVVLALLFSKILTFILTFRSLGLPWPDLRLKHIPASLLASLLKYGIIYALAFFVTRLNYRVDILILKRLSEIAEVGYYSLGVNIAETIWQVPTAVGLVLMTHSAQEKNQTLLTSRVCSTLRISLIVTVIAATALYFLAPVVVRLFFGIRYMPSVPIVRTILPGILFFVVLKIINSQFVGKGQPQLAIYALLPSVVINVILNFLLIPRYQGIGAAWSTNISYFCGSFILLLIYSRTFAISLADIFRFQNSDFGFIFTFRNRWR